MARPARLSDDDVAAALADLPAWTRDGDAIRRAYPLPSFADAIAFVVRVGFVAERADHHPDIDVRWRTVTLTLTTHDAGGLTQLDVDLARAADAAGRALGARD